MLASNPGFPFRILSHSFQFFSKAARQNPERKVWVWGYQNVMLSEIFLITMLLHARCSSVVRVVQYYVIITIVQSYTKKYRAVCTVTSAQVITILSYKPLISLHVQTQQAWLVIPDTDCCVTFSIKLRPLINCVQLQGFSIESHTFTWVRRMINTGK